MRVWGAIAAVGMVAALTAAAAGEPPRLVGRWSSGAEDGALLRDEAGVRPGRISGAEWDVAADRPALRFAGDQARVDLPRDAAYAFDHTESFTVELWLRTEQAEFATPLMARDGPGGTVSFSFVLNRRPDRVAFELWSWQRVKLISRTRVADGEWHHVVGVYDADDNRAALFVDGGLEAVGVVGSGGPREVNVRLGNNIDAHQPYRGWLADLAIWSGVSDERRAAMADSARWQVMSDEQQREMLQGYLDRLMPVHSMDYPDLRTWEERRLEVRRHVLRSLGLDPLPERLPLRPTITATLERNGYVVHRLWWQTWPDVWASGYLYLPAEIKAPAPAVLCPHGHWEHGAKNPVVQTRCIVLAKMGYVVLAVDSVHVHQYEIGLTPLSVMTWNNIRALDYLLERGDVDPERIGCTGCSGGGQQTIYLMAIEDRIKAAVPVCMVCYFKRILAIDSAHCHCNHVPQMMRHTDKPEMCAVFAPRPALFLCVTQDWTKWFPEDGFPDIAGVYELYGARERTDVQQWEWKHDYNQEMRERAYGWFERWLRGRDVTTVPEPEVQTEEVATLANMGGPPEGAQPVIEVRHDYVARLGFPTIAAADKADQRKALFARRELLAELLAESTLPREKPDSERLRRRKLGPHTAQLLTIETEAGVSVPAAYVAAEKPGASGVVLACPDGFASLMLGGEASPVAQLAEEGWAVLAVDPRFYGEWGQFRQPWTLTGLLIGRDVAAMAACDLRAAAAWLGAQRRVDPAQVYCVAEGPLGVSALLAAALDQGIAGVSVTQAGGLYRDRADHPPIGRLLTVADLPEVVELIAPRPVWLSGVAEGWRAGKPAPRGRLRVMGGEEQPGWVEQAEWLRVNGRLER